MPETSNIKIAQGSPYSLVGATFSVDGRFSPEIKAAQEELNRLGYNIPVDGTGGTGDHRQFLNALETEQNKQLQAGQRAMGEQGFTDYVKNNLRDGQANYGYNNDKSPLNNTGNTQAEPLDPNAPSGHSAAYLADLKNQALMNASKQSVSQGTQSLPTPAQNLFKDTTKKEVKPTGLEMITGTLNSGSSGEQVKALQQYLSGIGYKNADGTPLKIDGIYGPLTKAAVTQFQSQNGLTADGVFGPKSLDKTKTISNTNTSAVGQNDAVVGGNSGGVGTQGNTITYNGQTYTAPSKEEATQWAEFLTNVMQPLTEQMKTDNMVINPELDLGEDVISKILEKAKSLVRPEFAQKIKGVQEDLQRSVKSTTDAYGREVSGQESNFQNELGNARESFAGAGLGFSGQRGKGELGMQSSQDRSLASLSDQYGNALGGYARTAEKSLGTSGMNGFQLPGSLQKYSSSLSGNGGFNSGGGFSNYYQPGTYQIGEIPQAETASALALRNTNVAEASRRKTAGLSFADLMA